MTLVSDEHCAIVSDEHCATSGLSSSTFEADLVDLRGLGVNKTPWCGCGGIKSPDLIDPSESC